MFTKLSVEVFALDQAKQYVRCVLANCRRWKMGSILIRASVLFFGFFLVPVGAGIDAVAASNERTLLAQNLQANCPDGYRLHYQGFCINIEDEIKDDPTKGVRTVSPITFLKPESYLDADPLPETGYKFSNMKHGEYCKDAYVRISRTIFNFPTAYALGDDSCGISEIDAASDEAAKAHAMAECNKHTQGCRIIYPEE